MNKQEQLAAFIDSCQGLRFESASAYGGTTWQLMGGNEKATLFVNEGHLIRIAPGQLDPFGIPHSLSHLIHNPAGLSAADITWPDGRWRAALSADSAYQPCEVWTRGGWIQTNPFTDTCFGVLGLTYRLPALTPLPKVEAPTNEPLKRDELVVNQLKASPWLQVQMAAFRSMHRRAQKAESSLAKATKEARKWKGNAEFWHREFMRHHGIASSPPLLPFAIVPLETIDEMKAALSWCQIELGKHTRPSPIDNVLIKLNKLAPQ